MEAKKNLRIGGLNQKVSITVFILDFVFSVQYFFDDVFDRAAYDFIYLYKYCINVFARPYHVQAYFFFYDAHNREQAAGCDCITQFYIEHNIFLL